MRIGRSRIRDCPWGNRARWQRVSKPHRYPDKCPRRALAFSENARRVLVARHKAHSTLRRSRPACSFEFGNHGDAALDFDCPAFAHSRCSSAYGTRTPRAASMHAQASTMSIPGEHIGQEERPIPVILRPTVCDGFRGALLVLRTSVHMSAQLFLRSRRLDQ